jgi:hypothetical protein
VAKKSKKTRDKAESKGRDKGQERGQGKDLDKASKKAAKKAAKKEAKKEAKKAAKEAAKAQPRKAANRKGSVRQAIKAKTHAKKRPKQRFTVSHLNETDFDQGLRSYAKYRDLGLAPATGGMVQAHVIRFIPPFKPEGSSTPHFHDVELQMVYVLKGWYKTEFEGEGVHTFHAGACWLQPPKIKHTVLGYSDDCELLEIVLPAEFETVTLGK